MTLRFRFVSASLRGWWWLANLVELGFANQERVMLWRDFAVGVHAIEISLAPFSVITI
jgi:hypothetical protein